MYYIFNNNDKVSACRYRNEDGRLINLPNSPAKLLSIFTDSPNGGRKCLYRTNYRWCPSSPFHGWLVWQVLTQKYDWLPLCWTKQLSPIEEKLFWRRGGWRLSCSHTSFRKGLKKLLMKIDDTKREREGENSKRWHDKLVVFIQKVLH